MIYLVNTKLMAIKSTKYLSNQFYIKNAITVEWVYNELFLSLCVFAFKFVDNKEDAEDIVQNVFLNLANKFDILKNFSDYYELKRYLYRAVKNGSLNLIYHKNIQKEKLITISKLYENDDIIEIQIIKDEILREVFTEIDNLPDKCRTTFIHSYIDGWSNNKIAEKLNVSINTVKTQKLIAKKRLRSVLNFKGKI